MSNKFKKMSYLNYLEVLVLIVPGPVVGVPLLEGVPVHRVGGDVPAGNTNVNYSNWRIWALAPHAQESFDFQKISGTLKFYFFKENLQIPSFYFQSNHQ